MHRVIRIAASAEAQREHWPIAAAQAKRKEPQLQAALDRIRPRLDSLMRLAQLPHAPRKARLRHLLRAASLIADSLASIGACRRGCGHCCHQPVAVAPLEAEIIGEGIGIKPAKPRLHARFAGYARGYDHPCQFLADDGGCSIYEHRPFGCRVLVNLADDAHQCEFHDGEAADVPYLDARQLQMLYGLLVLPDGGLAELGDFFPERTDP